MKLCKCGCGTEIPDNNTWVHGHNARDPETRKKMSNSHKGLKPSRITRDKMSKAQSGEKNSMYGKDQSGEKNPMYGKKHSNKSIKKMSKANKGEKNPMYGRIGGHDIVGHHMIYDHSDLTKNVMPMTRSMHTRLHNLLRKNGIEIPHINIKED